MDKSANWYHFAITTDGDTVNIYQNGERLEVNMSTTSGQYTNRISCNSFYFFVSSQSKTSLNTSTSYFTFRIRTAYGNYGCYHHLETIQSIFSSNKSVFFLYDDMNHMMYFIYISQSRAMLFRYLLVLK